MIRTTNQQTFALEIEKFVKERDLSYIEAICEFCKEKGLDIESIPKLVGPQLKAKIENEAVDLNLFGKNSKIKKKKTLPFL